MSKIRREATFKRQIKKLDGRLIPLRRLNNRLSNLRLLIILLGVLGVFVAVAGGSVGWAWGIIGLTILLFAGLVAVHRGVILRIRAYEIWGDLKREHLARMNLDWEGTPASARHLGGTHPIETDLDLRQIHRLLNTASTRAGAERLQKYLLNLQPERETILARQAIVKELIPLVLFRDKLRLVAALANEDQIIPTWDGEQLILWLGSHRHDPAPRWILPALLILGLSTVLLFTAFVLNLIGAYWVGTWVVYLLLFASQYRSVGGLGEDGLKLLNALRQTSAVLSFIAAYRYGDNAALQAQCQPIISAQPKQLLRRLSWVVGAGGLQRNPIAWGLVNAIIPWDVFFGGLLDSYKRQLADDLPGWLNIWYELEALSSLATFAYLNPEASFPTILEAPRGGLFKAEGIGHPLIHDAKRVCNDFAFSALGQTALITGSNMAGKSSFLRALGVNLCLAYAGGVVIAQSLEVIPLRLFTSIRVTDSIDDGISYFYAEVKRLRALLEAVREAEATPVFYLIDEIFRGTNNRERLIGSRAYIEAVTGGAALGLVATHDLELVKLAETNPNIQNFHFREEVREGQMVFDYTLQTGPCPTTNALKIMALEGLPVGLDTEEGLAHGV